MKEQENLTGKGITAAVLDTGIFPHMDFDGRIVAFRDLVYGRETPYDDNGHGMEESRISSRRLTGCAKSE